jgi:ankyrin repeat protein
MMTEMGKRASAIDGRAYLALFLLSISLLMVYGCQARAQRAVGTVRDMRAQPVEEAVRKGDCAAIQQLLGREPSLARVRDSAGYTPLHWASIDGRKDVVALLLANGAEIDAGTPQGATPLHFAAGSGRRDAVELLIKNGADLHRRDGNGRTPLARAQAAGHSDVVGLLRSFGAKY